MNRRPRARAAGGSNEGRARPSGSPLARMSSVRRPAGAGLLRRRERPSSATIGATRPPDRQGRRGETTARADRSRAVRIPSPRHETRIIPVEARVTTRPASRAMIPSLRLHARYPQPVLRSGHAPTSAEAERPKVRTAHFTPRLSRASSTPTPPRDPSPASLDEAATRWPAPAPGDLGGQAPAPPNRLPAPGSPRARAMPGAGSSSSPRRGQEGEAPATRRIAEVVARGEQAHGAPARGQRAHAPSQPSASSSRGSSRKRVRRRRARQAPPPSAPAPPQWLLAARQSRPPPAPRRARWR